jgi:hypothetical protein
MSIYPVIVPLAYIQTAYPPLQIPAGVNNKAPSGVHVSLRKKLGKSSFSYILVAFSPGIPNAIFLEIRVGGLVAR